MQDYQREFIKFALDNKALLFGEFKIKSGRVSPYFFNAGCFNSGKSIACLGQFYAQAIIASGIEYDMLFGPAYKGIPLVTSVAIALADHHGIDKPYAFNRKEAKLHAEGGVIVGSPLQGNVLVIDDVISAGVTIGESVTIIRRAAAHVAGITISMDREERTQHGNLSAATEVSNTYQVRTINIVRLTDLMCYLEESGQYAEELKRIAAYHQTYGGIK